MALIVVAVEWRLAIASAAHFGREDSPAGIIRLVGRLIRVGAWRLHCRGAIRYTVRTATLRGLVKPDWLVATRTTVRPIQRTPPLSLAHVELLSGIRMHYVATIYLVTNLRLKRT